MRFPLSKSNQKVSRGQDLNPEPFSRFPEIPDVICHNCIGLTVNRNIQNHVVVSVSGEWSMLDPNQNWSRYGFQQFNDGFRIFLCSPGCRNVLRTHRHFPILTYQFVIHQQRQLSYRCQPDNFSGSPSA